MTLINDLHHFLESEEYQSVFLPASEKLPLDSLLVLLGLDYQKREQKLEIVEFNQNLNMMSHVFVEKEVPQISRLQFKIILSFKVDDLAINDVGAFIHFINQSIDLPGYEFDELEGQVSYRYVWITSGDNLNQAIVKTILTVISLNLAIFTEIIESLALKKRTFNDLLSDIVNKYKGSS
jgi:hypothetical protein